MARTEDEATLVRTLNLGQATSLVVGIVIGSGIFLGANRVAQGVDGVWGIVAVWVGAGVLTLLGALTYAEFGALYPRSGGDYVYASEALSPFWGFFNGWLTFAINYPASLAALALAWAGQLEQLKPDTHMVIGGEGVAVKFTAIALLSIFAIINYLGVRQAGWTQLGVTVAKVGLIAVLILLVLFSEESDAGRLAEGASAPTRSLAVALVGAMWAYDGWTGITKAAGEVREPQRNIPRALILGTVALIAIYVALSLTYVLALGVEGMRGTGLDTESARAVASRSVEAMLGRGGEIFVTVVILTSILGPINGLTLAGPRVYYAMAKDRLFPAALQRVHPVRRVPHISIFFQTGLSAFLALLFTFEQLTAYVVLAGWLAYATTAVALIRHRVRHPELERPYKVPGFPVVPVAFLLLSAVFILYLGYDSLQTTDRLLGLPRDFVFFAGNVLVILLAVPLYYVFVRRAAAGAVPVSD